MQVQYNGEGLKKVEVWLKFSDFFSNGRFNILNKISQNRKCCRAGVEFPIIEIDDVSN